MTDFFIIGFGGVLCAFLFMPGRISDVGAYRMAVLSYFARYGIPPVAGLFKAEFAQTAAPPLEAAALIASAWFILRAILGKKS